MSVTGRTPADPALFRRALTHGSRDEPSYERLEFLGDRVLGISMAEWLYELYPAEPEGVLTRRFNLLVSGAVCAEVAREIGVRDHLRLGKQAYNDGAGDSDYVLGDAVEALLGALYLDGGLETARMLVRRLWAERIRSDATADKHPKAALQDWASAQKRGAPAYELVEATGPDHARRHTVAVRLGTEEARATATTKREAEAEAARLLLARLAAEPPPPKRKRSARPRTILPARSA